MYGSFIGLAVVVSKQKSDLDPWLDDVGFLVDRVALWAVRSPSSSLLCYQDRQPVVYTNSLTIVHVAQYYNLTASLDNTKMFVCITKIT
jgi:hypothetical protein